MRITRLRTALVDIPLPRPVRSVQSSIESVGCVLVYLDTDVGLTGEGFAFSINGKRLGLLHEMVRSLEPLVVGEDPWMTERFFARAWADCVFIGRRGVSLFGISAVDMAIWDLKGKDAGKPLHQLLGGVRDEVPVYASGGLWMSSSIEELVDQAEAFVAQGFTAVKMRIGSASAAEDVRRVRAVREAVGPDIRLMADATQSMTVPRAVALGRLLEPFALDWFEEPVPAEDPNGLAAVAGALDVPVATGENAFTRTEFHHLLEKRAASVLMPDLQRVGGFTEMARVAHTAHSYGVTVSPHLFTEYSVSVVAAFPNATWLEHTTWFAPLFDDTLEMTGGLARVPVRPGNGFPFSSTAVDRYRI